MISIDRAKQIIAQEIRKNGYVLVSQERDSKSSNSFYYTIANSRGVQLLFRVSDHKTNKPIATLRIDGKMKEENVRRFVANRCQDLKKRSVKQLLGM